MSVNILLKRSSTASKRPVAASMAFGEVDLNYDAATGGLYYKDTAGTVVKVGPCQVSATAPNSVPGGSSGNSPGEFWYDTATDTLKVFNGTVWKEAGGAVDGVTGTAPVTVDNTDPLNPVVGINSATTTAPGAVQLNDSVISTSTTEALTANQGRNLQEQINALAVSSNLTLAGTLDATTGFLVTVTTEGAAQGFTVGSVLPSPAAGNSEFFVIATVGAASYTPPGGSATEVHVGDWFLSNGTVWNFLDVGFQASYATTSAAGVVQLATDAEVQAGVNVDHAIVPSALQSKLSDSVSTSSSTTIASSTAVKSAYDAGVQGQTDAAAAQSTADAALPKAGGTMTGAIVFAAGQTLPVDGLPDATTSSKGVVQVGTNIDVTSGTISVATGSTSTAGVLQLTDSTSSTSTTTAATPNAVKTAYDLAAAALPKSGGSMSGNVTFSDTGEGLVFSDSSSITGLSDSISSTSTTIAASSAAVKAAYDAAVAAAQANGPLTSDTVLYVNATDGNDTTAARGTDKPFATITAALAAATDGDTIFLSAGTFTENVTISKGVHFAGVFCDQGTWQGTKIIGNTVVNLAGPVTRNLAISDVYFISANSTSPFSVTGMSPGAGGINTVTGCMFTQQTVTDTAQFAVQTSGTWSRSLYFRECTFDGNFKHNAGTVAGASGYVVIDQLLGVGNSNMYHYILTGTAEYRNPSNSLASILQTGGIVLVNNASSGITPNGATTTAVFGGTGFSYKGTAAAAGAGTVYFQGGNNQGTGKVDIGANVIYGWTALTMDPANLTINVAAIPYTTAVPAAASAITATQQRPRLDLLKTTSSVTAANQLATVIDGSTGALYTVSALDAGTY